MRAVTSARDLYPDPGPDSDPDPDLDPDIPDPTPANLDVYLALRIDRNTKLLPEFTTYFGLRESSSLSLSMQSYGYYMMLTSGSGAGYTKDNWFCRIIFS